MDGQRKGLANGSVNLYREEERTYAFGRNRGSMIIDKAVASHRGADAKYAACRLKLCLLPCVAACAYLVRARRTRAGGDGSENAPARAT